MTHDGHPKEKSIPSTIQKDWLGHPVRRRPCPIPGMRDGVDWLGRASRRPRSTLPACRDGSYPEDLVGRATSVDQ